MTRPADSKADGALAERSNDLWGQAGMRICWPG